MGHFSPPDINPEYHIAETKRSRRFPKHLDAIFWVQVLGELTRKGALLDLLLGKRGGLVGEV